MPEATTLYTPTGTVARSGRPLTVTCPAAPPAQICGNYAVNTMLPFAPPSGTFSPVIPAQNGPTIGDRLTDAVVDWAWYAGGWNDAVAGHADATFQPQHQPFAYFTNYGPTGSGRSHLQDETDFSGLVHGSDEQCQLKPVSFVKPIGAENEHPGYASTPDGNTHLTNTLRAIENSACAKDTMVIVTYDEFGGEWDHVSPPGQGNNNGPHDVWGPGTRVPALIVAPHLKHDFVVDSDEHDTTSILATLEHRYGLDPLGSRDAVVSDLSSVFGAQKP